jgi:hypothetical protein
MPMYLDKKIISNTYMRDMSTGEFGLLLHGTNTWHGHIVFRAKDDIFVNLTTNDVWTRTSEFMCCKIELLPPGTTLVLK